MLEVIGDDHRLQQSLHNAMLQAGYTYPERELSQLQEDINDALVTVEG